MIKAQSKDTEVPFNTSRLLPPTPQHDFATHYMHLQNFLFTAAPSPERHAGRERISETRTWVTDGRSSSSESDELLLSDVSLGWAAPGTAVDAGLAWLAATAGCFTALFLRDRVTGAAGALFTGVVLDCTVFTAGLAWEQRE